MQCFLFPVLPNQVHSGKGLLPHACKFKLDDCSGGRIIAQPYGSAVELSGKRAQVQTESCLLDFDPFSFARRKPPENVALVGIGFTSAIWAVVVLLPLAAFSDMAPPLMTAFAANRVGEDEQGLVQGVIASLSSVAAVAAPLALTGVFENFVDSEGIYLPGAPFLVGAAMIVLIVPLLLRLKP